MYLPARPLWDAKNIPTPEASGKAANVKRNPTKPKVPLRAAVLEAEMRGEQEKETDKGVAMYQQRNEPLSNMLKSGTPTGNTGGFTNAKAATEPSYIRGLRSALANDLGRAVDIGDIYEAAPSKSNAVSALARRIGATFGKEVIFFHAKQKIDFFDGVVTDGDTKYGPGRHLRRGIHSAAEPLPAGKPPARGDRARRTQPNGKAFPSILRRTF